MVIYAVLFAWCSRARNGSAFNIYIAGAALARTLMGGLCIWAINWFVWKTRCRPETLRIAQLECATHTHELNRAFTICRVVLCVCSVSVLYTHQSTKHTIINIWSTACFTGRPTSMLIPRPTNGRMWQYICSLEYAPQDRQQQHYMVLTAHSQSFIWCVIWFSCTWYTWKEGVWIGCVKFKRKICV